jgi:hypothetical protein
VFPQGNNLQGGGMMGNSNYPVYGQMMYGQQQVPGMMNPGFGFNQPGGGNLYDQMNPNKNQYPSFQPQNNQFGNQNQFQQNQGNNQQNQKQNQPAQPKNPLDFF